MTRRDMNRPGPNQRRVSGPTGPGVELGADLLPGKRRDGRFLLLILLAVVLSVACLLSVRPINRKLKLRRARAISEEIQRRMAGGEGTNLLQRVRLMVRLAPADPLVLRAAAEFCTHNRMAEAFTYWSLVMENTEGSREDRLAYAQAAADAGRYDIAVGVLGPMLTVPGGDLEAARVALGITMKRGAWELAARMADHVLELAPDDSRAELWRAIALVRTGAPTNIDRARASLIALMHRDDAMARKAADSLLEIPVLSDGELHLLLRRLTDLGTHGAEDHIRVASVVWRLRPGEREALLESVGGWVNGDRTPEELKAVGRWMLEHGAEERLLELFRSPEVAEGPVGMRLRVLALARLGRWDDVLPLVDSEQNALDPSVRILMAVVRASLQGEDPDPKAVRAVLADRAIQPAEVLEAVTIAEEFGLKHAAILLLEHLLDYPHLMPEAANRILVLASSMGRLGLAHLALQRLVGAFPDDPVALQELGYLEAVRPGGNLGVIRRLRGLPGTETNEFAQMVFALSEIREMRYDEALTRLVSIQPPEDVADYRLHMAYAAAYGGAGIVGLARHHAGEATRGSLSLEERALVSRWLPKNP